MPRRLAALLAMLLVVLALGVGLALYRTRGDSGPAESFARYDDSVLQAVSVPAGVSTTTPPKVAFAGDCLVAEGRPAEPVAVHYFDLSASDYASDPIKYFRERSETLGWRVSVSQSDLLELQARVAGTDGVVRFSRLADGGITSVVEMQVRIDYKFCS